MRTYLFIVVSIVSIHFLGRGWRYAGSVLAKGKVVGYGQFPPSRIRAYISGSKDRHYPIAQLRVIDDFPGVAAVATTEVSIEEVVNAVNWDSLDHENMKRILLDKEKELKELKEQNQLRKPETGIYRTHIPEGGIFFRLYYPGEPVDVIYPRGHPEDAVVYSSFSYWLDLGSLRVLVIICVYCCGLHRFAKFLGKDARLDLIRKKG